MKKLFFTSIAILIACFMLLDICAEAAEKKPQYGGTLTGISYPRAPKATRIGNPPAIFGADAGWASQMLENLVRYEMEEDRSVGFRGVLATSWKTSPDGLTREFKLRKGVKFHDGTDFDAKAAKYNHDLLRKEHGTALKSVASIDVVDSHTIRYNLSKPDNTFLADVSETYAAFISPTAKELIGPKWSAENPIGTNAYKFVSYEQDVELVMKRFDDYWDPKLPYVDEVKIHYVKEALVAQAAVEKGQDLFITRAAAKEAIALEKKGYVIVTAPSVLRIITFDSKNPKSVFAKKKVRQAIGYAINRKVLSETLDWGYNPAAYQTSLEGSYAYNPTIKPRKYDPEKAKKLLVEAGYPDGIKINIYIEKLRKRLWTAIQAQLQESGIEAKIKVNPSSKMRQFRTSASGAGGLAVNSILSNHISYKPDYILGFDQTMRSTSSRQPDLQRPAGLDEALIEAAQATDTAGKAKATQKAVQIIYEDATVVPVYWETVFWATHPSVHNIKHTYPDHSHRSYKDAWIEK